MSSVKSAFAGAVAAATAITVSFPFELARVRVQTRTAEEEAQEVLDGVSYWTRLRSACDHALSPALGIRIGSCFLLHPSLFALHVHVMSIYGNGALSRS